MKVDIKLDKGAVMPSYGTNGAAGLDLTAITRKFIQSPTGPIWEYETGVSLEIPEGYVGLIYPRSSITSKTTLMLGNCVGVVDSDYRGTIKFQFRQVNDFVAKLYEKGNRIGQIIIIPYPNIELNLVEKLTDTDRGESGFGSTGK